MFKLIEMLIVTYIVTLIIGLPVVTWARDGGSSSGGGTGIVINGKPYLLDLVEAGVQDAPYFNEKTDVSPNLKARINQIFGDPEQKFPVELITRKLAEVMYRDYSAGLLMLKTMELFRWRLVDKAPLRTNDQREALKVDENEYIQLAKRIPKSILINKEAWAKMDDGNKTALVFHEVNYAMAKPIKNKNGYYSQDIAAIQEFTGFLFCKDFYAPNSSWTFLQMTENILPKEFFFNGQWYVNESPYDFAVRLTPTLKIILTKDINDDEISKGARLVKKLYTLAMDGNIDGLIEEESQEICRKVNDERKFAKQILVIDQRYPWFGKYEAAPNESYSYVKVSKEEPTWSGVGHPINHANCKDVIRKLFLEAKQELSKFEMIYTNHSM